MRFSYDIKVGFGVDAKRDYNGIAGITPSVHVTVRGDDLLIGRLLFPDFGAWQDFKDRHFPAMCEGYGCTEQGTAGTIRDQATGDDLPACAKHRDDAEQAA